MTRLHSTGPSTDAGKATTRLNATRHGLTSQVACMPWEDRAAFNHFCSALAAEYRPDGLIETELAQSIAEDHWRLNRVRAIDHNIFALGLATSTLEIEVTPPSIQTTRRSPPRSSRPRPSARRRRRSVSSPFMSSASTAACSATSSACAASRPIATRPAKRPLPFLPSGEPWREKLTKDELQKETLRSGQADEPKPEGRGAPVRSSETQTKRSGLVPTNGPQEDKSLAIGFVHSNDHSKRFTRRRSLDERIAEVELLTSKQAA